MADVLVVFATKKGSTGEVADAIADVLRQRGNTVTFAPAGRFRDPIDAFDLIVLGGALYSGRWHSGAHRFLRRHHRELSNADVAVFGMGPRSDTADAWQRSRAQLDRALAKRPWLHPVAVAVFGGVDPPKKREQRNLRDWSAIAMWAEALFA